MNLKERAKKLVNDIAMDYFDCMMNHPEEFEDLPASEESRWEEAINQAKQEICGSSVETILEYFEDEVPDVITDDGQIEFVERCEDAVSSITWQDLKDMKDDLF